MKTTFLVGLVAAAAMNLMACTSPGLGGGCAVADPAVDEHVAPLTFQATSATEACDATNGVVLDLTDAAGSSIRVAVKPGVQLSDSLPLTATGSEGNALTSASADNNVKVTLTDAEYNELPNNWQNAAVTIDTMPLSAGNMLVGEVQFYFADGRTLDVTFDNALQTACPVAQTN